MQCGKARFSSHHALPQLAQGGVIEGLRHAEDGLLHDVGLIWVGDESSISRQQKGVTPIQGEGGQVGRKPGKGHVAGHHAEKPLRRSGAQEEGHGVGGPELTALLRRVVRGAPFGGAEGLAPGGASQVPGKGEPVQGGVGVAPGIPGPDEGPRGAAPRLEQGDGPVGALQSGGDGKNIGLVP